MEYSEMSADQALGLLQQLEQVVEENIVEDRSILGLDHLRTMQYKTARRFLEVTGNGDIISARWTDDAIIAEFQHADGTLDFFPVYDYWLGIQPVGTWRALVTLADDF